jgi:hypothetical protein
MTKHEEAVVIPQDDPCDGWPWAWPRTGYRWPADRKSPDTFEGFEIRPAQPVIAKFLPYVKSDFAHWRYDLDWTLESGPDSAPSSIDIVIPYNYSHGTSDSYMQPGDPPEHECGTPWFVNEHGQHCEVSLTSAEWERVDTWISENPPEEPYYDYD